MAISGLLLNAADRVSLKNAVVRDERTARFYLHDDANVSPLCHAEREEENKIGKPEWKELTIEATTNKGSKKEGRPLRKAKRANFVLQLTNRAKKP